VIARTSNGTPSNQYSTIVPKGEQGTSASQSTDKIKSETLATVQKLKSMSTVVKAVPAGKFCQLCLSSVGFFADVLFTDAIFGGFLNWYS